MDLSDKDLSKMHTHTENDIGNADLMLYFGYDPECDDCAWGGGMAYKVTVIKLILLPHKYCWNRVTLIQDYIP